MTGESEVKRGFWARQFAREITPSQFNFDFLFGVALPVLCLVMDPIVFKGSGLMGGGMLRRYAIGAYLFIGGSIVGLLLWYAVRRWPLLFAGPFLAGGLFALGVGIVLAPFALPMTLVGIGFLGLVPFGTAFTFLRNGVRAVRRARPRTTGVELTLAVVLVGALAVGVPVGANLYVQSRVAQALADVTSDDAERREVGLGRLRLLGRFAKFGADLDRIVWDWHEETDPARKARLSEAYEAATGQSIQERWWQLTD